MPLLNRVESAFNPTVRGRYFGYVEPPVFRRIDELAELENGYYRGQKSRSQHKCWQLRKSSRLTAFQSVQTKWMLSLARTEM